MDGGVEHARVTPTIVAEQRALKVLCFRAPNSNLTCSPQFYLIQLQSQHDVGRHKGVGKEQDDGEDGERHHGVVLLRPQLHLEGGLLIELSAETPLKDGCQQLPFLQRKPTNSLLFRTHSIKVMGVSVGESGDGILLPSLV